jgi:tetratricopeptide repeat protein/adenylate/guanylate cyclase family protein
MNAPDGAGQQTIDASAWLERVRAEERRGELLYAVDLAERGLAEHPGDLALEHRLVLALARAGATDEAARRYRAFGLERVVDDEDVAALGARIAKDRALRLIGEEGARAAAEAAGRYAAIYARTRGYYPAVNAATLWLAAGEADRAGTLAREVLALTGREDGADYYVAATEAEAHLLLGDEEAAAAAVARAGAAHQGDYGALASTRRQLRWVCDLRGADPALLAGLAGPAVAHFCGHMIAAPGADGRFLAADEAIVAGRIAGAVAERPIGYAYGALAAGADILWAEALLAAGSELHVVLPCHRDKFLETSVAPAGAAWAERFAVCLGRATNLTYATEDASFGDDCLFRYGAELAMGLALTRARYLDAEPVQLAVWDGGPAHGDAGTAIDVANWLRGGRASVVVGAGAGRGGAIRDQPVEAPVVRGPGRVVRALLFGDVRDFTKLVDEQLPRFTEHVLGAFARVVESYGDAVEYRNTWGDAICLVISDVERAAACALALQQAMGAIDLDGAALPPELALRLGGHVGPVFPIHDPVIDRLGFMGSHISRTARIEPVTPPGEVYVTESFAAAIALCGAEGVVCDYVGSLPAAKGFGSMRMYRLHRGQDRLHTQPSAADALGELHQSHPSPAMRR